MKKVVAAIVTCATCVVFAGVSPAAYAAAFALNEQNASGMGNAYAGQAASAQDASTVYFNPAGMTLLPGRQLVGSIDVLKPSGSFTNLGSSATPLQPATGSNGGDFLDWAYVPSLYLSWQLSPRVFAGLGLNAPFGLTTDYTADWVGRFHGVSSDIKTVNINPSLAFKVNDVVSLGAGIDYQRIQASLTSMTNYSALLFAGGGGIVPGLQGLARVDGNDSAWGYNAGVLFNFGQGTRVGIAYRSALAYRLSGNVGFAGVPAPLAPGLYNGTVAADIKLPDNAAVSVFHRVNAQWDVMADATWTHWSTIKALTVYRTSGAAAGSVLADTPLNYRDAWRLSLGANYHVNGDWTLRGGVAYDQTPVTDFDRSARIPDSGRTWLALGAQYRVSRDVAIDLGYAHIFFDNASINQCGAAQAAANPAIACAGTNSLVGSYSAKADLLSLQIRWNF